VDWVIEKSKEPKDDAVTLSTIHGSKGLEWWTVFVVDLVEGILPHRKSLKGQSLREETRLCYVAITRSKENLYLMAAEQYGGESVELSRYIRVLQNN
jgi:DNA helicase-2/ATP-dependent DNA helicase PcrA